MRILNRETKLKKKRKEKVKEGHFSSTWVTHHKFSNFVPVGLPIRSPLRPGGGVVFGPKPRDWTIKINRKEKRLAISTALSSAAENMVCVEEFGEKFEKPRTKELIEAIRRWGLDPKEKVMFLVSDLTDNVGLSSRNIGTLRMLTPRTLNLFDILNSDKLVLTPDTAEYLNYMDEENAGVQTVDEDEEEG